MTRLDARSYVAHLRAESKRFRDVLATTPGDARVPSCPDWDADDLVWHLAGVQWFWGHVIGSRPEGPPEEQPERPASREAMLAFFDEVSGRLGDLLGAASPEDPAWSWADEQTVGFTQRRQAHEALIHRLDAELAAGQVTPLPPDLAADGVAEVLEVMKGGEPPSWGSFTPDGFRVALQLTDTGHRMLLASGRFAGTEPESGTDFDVPHLVPGDSDRFDATVSGTAGDVDAWLWGRADRSVLAVSGSEAAFAAFLTCVDQPID